MGRLQSPIRQWVESNINPSMSNHYIIHVEYLDKKGNKEWDDLADKDKYSIVNRVLNKNKRKSQPKIIPKQESTEEPSVIKLTEDHHHLADKLATIIDAYDDVCNDIDDMFEANIVESRVFEKSKSARDAMQEILEVLRGRHNAICTGAYKQKADYEK